MSVRIRLETAIPAAIVLVFAIVGLTGSMASLDSRLNDAFLALRPAPHEESRLLLVDFDDASHHGYWGGSRNALAEAARDVATEALVKSGAFVVIEREQIAQILKEQHLGMTGAISPQTAAKAGKLLGLQAIVTGKVTDFDADTKSSGFGGYYHSTKKSFHARVSLRVVDTTSGEIWIAESGEGIANSENTTVMGGGTSSVDNTPSGPRPWI